MKNYVYKGTNSSVSLREVGDIILWRDREYELPENNAWVISAIAQGLLVELVPSVPPKSEGKANAS